MPGSLSNQANTGITFNGTWADRSLNPPLSQAASVTADMSQAFSAQTGINGATKIGGKQVVIPPAGTVTVNLAADFSVDGQVQQFTIVRAFTVQLPASLSTASGVTVAPYVGRPWSGPWGTSSGQQLIHNNGAWLQIDPTAAGMPVTAGSNDSITFTNLDNTNQAIVIVAVLGE